MENTMSSRAAARVFLEADRHLVAMRDGGALCDLCGTQRAVTVRMRESSAAKRLCGSCRPRSGRAPQRAHSQARTGVSDPTVQASRRRLDAALRGESLPKAAAVRRVSAGPGYTVDPLRYPKQIKSTGNWG